jgi:ADP-ribose pyrophosphatase YjhB (NUDIX family)
VRAVHAVLVYRLFISCQQVGGCAARSASRSISAWHGCSISTIHSLRWLRIYFRLPNAIVRNDRDEVLLVRRADDGYWELTGGRIEVGESAMSAAMREVAEEAGVAITVQALAGVYSDPRHVLVYPGDRVHQQIAICFHARAVGGGKARPDTEEATEAGWFEPGKTSALPMHPTMRQCLDNGLDPHTRAHFD